MNFLKRRMFQDGGPAAIDERYFVIDKINNEKIYVTPNEITDILKYANLGTVEALIQNPDTEYSPDLQQIFRKIVGQRKAKISSVDPATMEFGEMLPDFTSLKSGFQDFGGFVGDFGATTIEQMINLGRKGLSGVQERGYDEFGEPLPEVMPIDYYKTDRFPFDENNPGGQATFSFDRFDKGMLRRGFTQEQLVDVLKQAQVGDIIKDFTPELTGLNTEVDASSFDFRDEDIAARQPKYIVPPDEFVSKQKRIDASPIQSETLGTISPEEAAERRAKFQESIEGVDEFGLPIPDFDKRTSMIDDGIAEAIRELQPAESKVDINKTEADTLLDTQDKFDGKFDPPKIELDKVDTKLTTGDKIREKLDTKTIPVIKETFGVFGSDRFLDFIRNVGGELVRTGQMGEGLASGAAKASEERAARELLQQQEDKKYKRDLALAVAVEAAKNAGKDPFTVSELDTISTKEEELAENIRGFNKSANTLSNLNYVIQTLQTGGATGLRGFFGEATDMIEAAISSNEGRPFEELKPRTRANALLNVLRQANVREILGESGKTISNLDRQIVEDVFGDIKITTPVSISIKKLEDSRVRIVDGMMEQQNKVIAAKSFFDKVGVESNVYNINQPIIDLIKSFSIADANAYIEDRDMQDTSVIDIDLGT